MNIAYNWSEIVRRLNDTEQDVFVHLQLIGVNAIAYAAGVSWAFYLGWPVIRAVHTLATGSNVAPTGIDLLRARCLRMGDYAFRLSAGLCRGSEMLGPALATG